MPDRLPPAILQNSLSPELVVGGEVPPEFAALPDACVGLKTVEARPIGTTDRTVKFCPTKRGLITPGLSIVDFGSKRRPMLLRPKGRVLLAASDQLEKCDSIT